MTWSHSYGNGGGKELCVDHLGDVVSGCGVHDLDLNLAEIGGEGHKES